MLKRKFVIAAAAAAVLVGGGTATALSLPSDDDAPAAAAAPGTGLDKAVATATAAVPGTVTGAEPEDDGAWDVDVFGKDRKWHDVTVDPAGTKVLRDHVGTDDDRDRHAPQGAPVTVQKAVEAALKAAPGHATEADLDDGRWEIEVRDEDGRSHDVNVDAKTGGATVVRDQDPDDGAGDDADRDAAAAAPSDGRGADSDSDD
jgi:uncharacterized membrane protein YkoI